MASNVSTLTMRLIDGVSGPAGRVNRALRGMDNAGQRFAERGGVGGWLAGGNKMIATLGGYAAVRGVMAAEKAYATFDRRMTRIGITADASATDIGKATQAVKLLATDVALPLDDVVEGLDALVAAGRSLPDAMAFLPAVSRTAQAAGAATVDIANSADALAGSFKISGDKMQSAFDILVSGGKAGKFELKDMAQYIPSLAPAMAAMGYSGEEGLSKLVAMLQLTRAQTGDASEAATNLANVFQKMESEETVKKFGEFGINLRKELGKAKKEGKDVIEVFLDLTEKATKGDLSKLTQLFTDAQYQKGVRALLTQRNTYKQLMDLLRNASGAVQNDLSRVTNDAASSVQRLETSVTKLGQSIGKLVDSAGGSSAMDSLSAVADDISNAFDRAAEAKKSGGIWEAVKTLNEEAAHDVRAQAVREAVKKRYGAEMSVGEANEYASPSETFFRSSVGEWRDDAGVLRDAEAWADRHYGKDRYRSSGRHPGLSARPVPTDRVGRQNVGDYTLRGGDVFSSIISPIQSNLYTGRYPGRLPPSAWHRDWRYPIPSPGYREPEIVTPGANGGGMPLPRRHPLRAEIEPSDFSKEAAASMESYRAGLQSQMTAAEAEVDAFVGRIQSKLSFSASPRVNVSLAASDAAVPATQTKSYQSGQKVADHLRGGFEDVRFS